MKRLASSSVPKLVLLAAAPTLVGLFLVGFAVQVHEHEQQFDVIARSQTGPNSVTWRIDRPNVKQRITAYPTIRFQPRDIVSVTAEGCVQRGGRGLTWARYVNPQGPNSYRLYSGLIDIPGVTPGLVRIGGWINRTFIIPPNTNPDLLYLSLGYEDDRYDDNGYDGHDDGWGNQCKNVGPARVTVSIYTTPRVAPDPAALLPVRSAPAPFDLVWDAVDYNGLPLNPKWASQVNPPGSRPGPDPLCNNFRYVYDLLDPRFPQSSNNPRVRVGVLYGSPACTTQQPSIDVASGFHGEACDRFGLPHYSRPAVRGHVNWGAATYEGRLTWEGHSLESPGGDHDYELRLFPPGGAGLTSGEESIELEFDSRETIDAFPHKTPWWDALHQDVHRADVALAAYSAAALTPTDPLLNYRRQEAEQAVGVVQAKINNRPAIAIGLFGLDCGHSCSPELHPVYALAINVDDNPSRDVWAIFVRNWGNEGYCSHFDHPLNRQSITFFLRRPGATSVSIRNETAFYPNWEGGGAGPFVELVPNEGARVTFYLPEPDARGLINGELHLQWAVNQAVVVTRVPRPPFPVATPPTGPQRAKKDTGKPEAHLRALWDQATPAQKQIALAKMPPKPRVAVGPIRPLVPLLLKPGERPPAPQSVVVATPRAGVQTMRALEKAKYDQAAAEALCAAFGGNVPGLPSNACAGISPPAKGAAPPRHPTK